MISLLVVFYVFVFLFGLIGSMRGWAKELLVIFSVVIAMALVTVIEDLVPGLKEFVAANEKLKFWIRIGSIVVVTFFGYQSPRISRLSKAVERRDRIQDVMLGLVLGLVSGFMVVGSIWFYVDAAGYFPIAKYVTTATTPELADSTDKLLKLLPPVWLGKSPNIFIAMVLGALFIVIVFV